MGGEEWRLRDENYPLNAGRNECGEKLVGEPCRS